eukprot:488310-Prymnesium_polylepis.2
MRAPSPSVAGWTRAAHSSQQSVRCRASARYCSSRHRPSLASTGREMAARSSAPRSLAWLRARRHVRRISAATSIPSMEVALWLA